MNIKVNLANSKNYGGSRSLESIKYIVIHYTANDGDTDENNGFYFKNNYVSASAHYFVDDDSVTQSVPDNRIAWHCGATYYRHAFCRNGNSIGIEICDDVRNGVIYPSAKTIANVIELTRHLMKKYSVPKKNVIRHYDVSGKLCPAYWVDDAKWEAEFWNKLDGEVNNESKSESTNEKVYYRVQVGAFSNKANVDALVKELKALNYGTYVVEIDGLYKVQVGAFSNRSSADELVSKLKSDGFGAFVTTKIGTPASETTTNLQLKIGDAVKLRKNAPVYNTSTLFQSWVYDSVLYVRGIYNDRVVISTSKSGPVTGAVGKNYLVKA